MSTLCNFGIYYNLSMRAYTLCIYIKILYNILQLTLHYLVRSTGFQVELYITVSNFH